MLLRKLFFIAIFFSGAFMMHSCTDESINCPDAKNTIINFTADELAKVPYTGTDTLYFLNNKGDTQVVVGQGKQYYYDREYSILYPSCPQNETEDYQAYKLKFTPIKGDLSFELTMQRRNYTLTINVKSYPINFDAEYPSVGIKNLSSQYYFDSLTVGNQVYKRVRLLLSYVKNEFNQFDTNYELFYNKDFGILKIANIQQGETYSIIKK